MSLRSTIAIVSIKCDSPSPECSRWRYKKRTGLSSVVCGVVSGVFLFFVAPDAPCYSPARLKFHERANKMHFNEKALVMSSADIGRVMTRLASEVVERNGDLENVLLVGIRRRGVPLAERLAARIMELNGVAVATGALDITLYRDDLSTVGDRPIVNKTELPADVTGRTI